MGHTPRKDEIEHYEIEHYEIEPDGIIIDISPFKSVLSM